MHSTDCSNDQSACLRISSHKAVVPKTHKLCQSASGLSKLLPHQDAEPENLEPDKCEGWEWQEWGDLPQPLFMGLQKLVDSGWQLGSDPPLLPGPADDA